MTDYDFLGPAPPAPDLKPVPLRPNQRPPAIDPARECFALTGGGPYRLTLQGTQAAPLVIRGGEKPCTGGECGLEFLDGSEWCHVQGVTATGNQHGIRFRGCRSFVVQGCDSHRNIIEGYVWGACHEFAVLDCVAAENGKVGGHAPDRCHGFYPSYHSSGIKFANCRALGNRGLGWHVNGTADEAGPPLEGLQLVSCVARGNGTGGSGNLDLNYLRGALILNCLLEGGRGGLSTFNDGAKRGGFGARGITIRQSTILSDGWALRLEKGGVVEVQACIVAGPVSVDGSSRLTQDAATLRASTVAGAAGWLGEGLKSLVPGVGWSG